MTLAIHINPSLRIEDRIDWLRTRIATPTKLMMSRGRCNSALAFGMAAAFGAAPCLQSYLLFA